MSRVRRLDVPLLRQKGPCFIAEPLLILKRLYFEQKTGGEGGIRTPDRVFPYAGFQDRSHQPLGHLSITTVLLQFSCKLLN